MVRSAAVPAGLRHRPFRGSAAIADGLLTRGRLAGGAWRRLLPDVYLHRDALLDHVTWCRAAILAAPAGTVVCGRSALGLYCLELMPAPEDPVEVAVPWATSVRAHPRLRINRPLLGPDETGHVGGLPATSPARTAYDLARRSDLVDTVVAVDALLYRRRLTRGVLAEFAEAHFGGPGSRRLRLAIALATPGAESPMETRTRLVLILAGLPVPVVQYDVVDASGFVARLDLAYPRYRVGIEYEGDHHRERAAFRRDVARYNRLRLAGWTVLRFTADDVLRHPATVVEQVRTVLTTAGCPLSAVHDPRE